MFLIQLQPLRVNDPGGHIAIPSVTRRTEAVTMCLGYIYGKTLAVPYSPPGAIPKTQRFLTVWFVLWCGGMRFGEVLNEPNRAVLPSNTNSVPTAQHVFKLRQSASHHTVRMR